MWPFLAFRCTHLCTRISFSWALICLKYKQNGNVVDISGIEYWYWSVGPQWGLPAIHEPDKSAWELPSCHNTLFYSQTYPILVGFFIVFFLRVFFLSFIIFYQMYPTLVLRYKRLNLIKLSNAFVQIEKMYLSKFNKNICWNWTNAHV